MNDMRHASLAPLALLLGVVLIGPATAVAGPASGGGGRRTVALLPPTGENVAPGILSATRELLKDHLQRSGAYTVVEPGPSSAPQTVEQTPAEAAQIAASLGAEQAITVRLTHFGTSARVRLTAYAAGTGQVTYWDSAVIVGGPNELDPIIQRLVYAMQTGRPVRESAELETVTEKETQALNRRVANKSFGVHIFTLLPVSTPTGEFQAVPGGGLFWLYDARSWMADISFDLGGQGGAAFWAAAIGGYYPLLREDFTPYIGGVVRWAYMELGGNGASGITFQPTLGILLGRLSSVQLRAEGGYFINSFGERPSPTPSTNLAPAVEPTDNSRTYGHGFAINVGLGF